MTYQTPEPIDRLSLHATSRCWGELVRFVQDGHITYDLPYQRGSVWTGEQRILLIHSILSGTPIPALIINRRPEDTWFGPNGERNPGYAVVDGKQRLITVRMFMENHLAVPASWFAPDRLLNTEATEDGPYVRWSGLSEGQRCRFDMAMPAPVAEGSLRGIQAEAELYLRVNGLGTPQTGADMRRAAQVAGQG